jgi:hypothetical protein
MGTALAKVAKKRARPVYLRVERLVRPETGEEVRAFVAMTKWDARELRERKCLVGDEFRSDLTKPRNVKLHRLGHALCNFIAERVPGFEDLKGHDALKRLQRECGAYCEEQEIDLGQLGKHTVKVARSIAFDSMADDEFSDLLKQIGRHIAENYLKDMTPDEVEAAIEMMVHE